MRTRIISSLALVVLVLGMTGCGGGGDGASTASQRKAVSEVSLAGLDQTVGGIQLNLNIPPGVTVQTDAAGVSSGVVELVGASGSSNMQKTYTTDPVTGRGRLMLLIIEPGGFTANQSIKVHLVITGSIPRTADFTIDSLLISDLNGRTISGLTPDFTVEII
jgi:hypothetical protein